MKLLIAYAGKTGSCRTMAELLKTLLPNHEVTVADLSAEMPVPTEYDYVVLGTAVRMGKPHRALKAYLKQYGDAVAALPHTLFLCCAIASQFENYLERCYPRNVLENAEETVYFGGELKVSAQKGIDRVLVRMMRNAIRESEDDESMLPGLLPEHVRLLADRLKRSRPHA
ncbi:MAG: hypothetical protein E7663_06660 [Ruminococcaceae bacterium]|nr:hypothetical protein [Oscillospiraceae bacterium]